MKTKIVLLIFMLTLIVTRASGQQKAKLDPFLGWDLSYKTVLTKYKTEDTKWLKQWLGNSYQSPVKKEIRDWRGEPIISSILIESPAFHAGERITFWVVRTRKHAFYRQFANGQPITDSMQHLEIKKYDKAFLAMSAWEPSKPLSADETPKDGVSGYLGFLSLYDRGKAQQTLLSMPDFFIFDEGNANGEKLGRLSEVMASMLKDAN